MTKNEKNTTHKTRPHTKLISHGFFNGRREVFSVVSQTSMVFPRRTFNKMRLLSRVPITNQEKKICERSSKLSQALEGLWEDLLNLKI